jgi:3-hydroxyacyl-[acyl-carrier-protein] dehydratase
VSERPGRRSTLAPLSLDAERIRALIPHRPPLLLIDGVEAMSTEPPALKAFKQIGLDEPVLEGHFPSQPIWPGAYCIEGLAQACAVLGALAGGEARQVLLAQVQIKLTAPVIPPARLEYHVGVTHRLEGLVRCEAEATVDGRVVATGTLMLAEVQR